MKHSHFCSFVGLILCATIPSAMAITTRDVNGVTGSDTNNTCTSSAAPCKTIGHAISVASSGDNISVAAATYKENLTIRVSLSIFGSGAATTIVDGGGLNTVAMISPNAHVALSSITIQDGRASEGGGIFNSGILTINRSTVKGNSASRGGGIFNNGMLVINNSTVASNLVESAGAAFGGGLYNESGTVTINKSTFSSNVAAGAFIPMGGGGIFNTGPNTPGMVMISNSTFSGNTVGRFGEGGAIDNGSVLTISNSTVSGNAAYSGKGGGISGTTTLKNTILANNSGGNCSSTMTSNGYNLSSDNTCSFNGPGDLNSTNPLLGTLGNYGGPTQTIPLLSGSPAIDAGNPSGCTDGQGHLLKTDQRGMPRPDIEDSTGCDMGAYERQSD